MHEDYEAALLRGKLNELRFFNAIQDSSRPPHWFIGLIKADFELDIRGVDAIAYIVYPNEDRCSRVPVQIKSSWSGQRRYLEEHAEYGGEDVLIIVVTLNRTPENLRKIFFAELRKIREKNLRFETYFADLFTTRVTEHAEDLRRRMIHAHMRKEMRRENILARHAPTASAVSPAKKTWWQRLLRM